MNVDKLRNLQTFTAQVGKYNENRENNKTNGVKTEKYKKIIDYAFLFCLPARATKIA